MKNIFIIFISAAFLLSCDKSNSIENIEKRNENWAWFVDEISGQGMWVPLGDETTIKNGEYTLFFCNGEIRQRGKLKDGIESDTIYYYDISGKLIIKEFENEKGEIKQLIPDGEFKSYYPSCEIENQCEIRNNKVINYSTNYYINGKVESNSIYINDSTKKLIKFYNNGIMSDSGIIINNESDGLIKHWYKNGQLKTLEHYNEGLRYGLFIWYYENGQIDTKCYYKNDIENGHIISYYENSKIKNEGNFKDGKEEGLVLNYFESGQLDSKINYSNGKENGEIWFYHPNGKLKMYAKSKMDVTTFYKSYDTTGVLIKKYNGKEVIEY